MRAKTFDRKFDAGEKVVDQLDLSKVRRAGTDAKRVNVDFPAWMVDSLDREARRMGVTRQSLIKLWLADRLGKPTAGTRRSWPLAAGRGRVEDWRADFRLRWVFHSFRGGPQSGCHHHVSSPRRIERSVRFARTTLTCALRTTAYGTYATETTFRRSRRNR